MHRHNDTIHAHAHTKYATKLPVHQSQTGKQTRAAKLSKIHSHGGRKQQHNKTSKISKQNRQLKQAKESQKSANKVQRTGTLICMLPLNLENTVSAAEKAKNESRGHVQQRTNTAEIEQILLSKV